MNEKIVGPPSHDDCVMFSLFFFHYDGDCLMGEEFE